MYAWARLGRPLGAAPRSCWRSLSNGAARIRSTRCVWAACSAAAVVVGARCAATPDDDSEESHASASFSHAIEVAAKSVCKLELFVIDQKTGKHRTKSAASGFVVSADGLIVTNEHVIAAWRRAEADGASATFDDGRRFALEFVGSDGEADVGVCRAIAPAGTTFRPLTVAPAARLSRGAPVACVSARYGRRLSAAVGTLSSEFYLSDEPLPLIAVQASNDAADDAYAVGCHILQCDIDVAPGSSGAPIIDSRGRAVGVVFGRLAETPSAVAMDQAWPIVQALAGPTGSVVRPHAGILLAPFPVDRLGSDVEVVNRRDALLPPSGPWIAGLQVTGVEPGGAGASAGLAPGDVILEVDGRPALRPGVFHAAMGPLWAPTTRLTLRVYRPRTAALTARDAAAAAAITGTTLSPEAAPALASGAPGDTNDAACVEFTTVLEPTPRPAAVARKGWSLAASATHRALVEANSPSQPAWPLNRLPPFAGRRGQPGGVPPGLGV